MEEHMFESSYMPVVRGNVFSYHMPWERILQSLERSTSDAKLMLLPHHPKDPAHIVQLHMKIGTKDLAKHIILSFLSSQQIKIALPNLIL